MNLMSLPARMAGLAGALALAGASAAVAVDARTDSGSGGPWPSIASAAPSTAPPAPHPTRNRPTTSPVQNHDITPGQYYSGLVLADICLGNATSGTPLTADQKRAVYIRYNIDYPIGEDASLWEVDAVVPLDLGGTTDITNLWPMKQPLAAQKDQLEDKLHADVCAGRLPLESAQQAIGTDWQAQYAAYFGRPPSS
jgi:hypothetical protein